MKTPLYSLILSLIIFACTQKGNKEVSNETKTPESAAKNCTYSYNDSTTVFEWKAYKTNEKVGVGGTFDNIKVVSESASSIKNILESISFEISTASVNSANEERDGKILSFFFNKMINTNMITGKVKSIDGDDRIGTSVFEVNLNDVTKDITMTYNTVDGALNFSGVMNLEDFNGQEAVQSLNKKCEALHTGADGVSILWPQVSLSISTKPTVICD